MSNVNFRAPAGPFTLAEIAAYSGAEPAEDMPADLEIRDVSILRRAREGEITFLDTRDLLPALKGTKASACILHPDFSDEVPESLAVLYSESPYLAFVKVAQAFHPEPKTKPGIAEGARVDESVYIGERVSVGAGAVVKAGVRLGDDVCIGANTVVHEEVSIGPGSRIGDNVSLAYCELGENVILHSGVRVGQDGFGYIPTVEGHVKVPQLGGVIIENDVEIGANTTVDRGMGEDTLIGAGTKIDNLVQIGHNVQIGMGCIIVAQVGISGSTVIEPFCAIGGQVGMAEHLHIGEGAQIAAKSGVIRDVPAGDSVMGTPAVPIKQFMRQAAILSRMARKKAGDGGEET